ncbi:hypothetical protein SEA_PIONEER3_104 [Microbacterium phage Pioneer3]|nr:hypothetical protein SEA_PIONEER3_104 [Microbacterium phage Pioneer3]
MTAIPKRIDFDDIKVGDTIRVVDVSEVKVVEHRGDEILTESGETYLARPARRGAERKFQLVERPILPLPTKSGSMIELGGGYGTWIFIYEAVKGRGVWINTHNGARQSVAFMRARANTAGGFEVIR